MSSELSVAILRYGSSGALPEQVSLRAGDLEMIFENGDLRYLTHNGVEVIRRIYAAVRDQNWSTIPGKLENLVINKQDESFLIEFGCLHQQGEIDFRWHARIGGTPEGQIIFAFDGIAHSAFLRNRIGFCVLHPAAASGAKCWVQHPDGSVEQGTFPVRIAPHTPFQEIAKFTHEAAPGVRARIEFSGDIFEMEDQRNWLDASFKTYCTPLRLGFPVQVQEGDRVHQGIRLTVAARPSAPVANAASDVIRVRLLSVEESNPARQISKIGFGVASHETPLSRAQLERLRALKPNHLRVDFAPSAPDALKKLGRADAEAFGIGCGLEVALFLSAHADKELQSLEAIVPTLKGSVQRWLIFHTEEKVTTSKWIELAAPVLRRLTPRAKIGAGTNAYFTELNRNPVSSPLVDFVCYSSNPQVHAFDNGSLVETLPMFETTIASAKDLAKERGVVLSPITLKMRFNADATGPVQRTPVGQLPPQVDPRQMSLFGAGWTVGSLAHALRARPESLTYFETTGWRGLMELEEGATDPALFHSVPGGVYPLYHVFAAVAGRETLRTVDVSYPLKVQALAVRTKSRTRMLIANVTNDSQKVLLAGLGGNAALKFLDERTAVRAMTHPEEFQKEAGVRLPQQDGQGEIALLPFGIAFVDCD